MAGCQETQKQIGIIRVVICLRLILNTPQPYAAHATGVFYIYKILNIEISFLFV